jgi:lipopolysaccharide biosynthesis protein
MQNNHVKAIAFYLPQYHPIPENDEWWGKGFTEWTNVAKAQPLFPDHYQPHIPADLGFYDLRLPEARQAQADLAREYGLYGFCYYHYWFSGRRILERPMNDILQSGEPDFPFCLCWANENWTRTWDGQEKSVLLEQHYSEADDREHLRSLADAFRDPRYIRIDGKPLFLVYRVTKLPDPKRTAQIWREEAIALGIGEIYLCRVESFGGDNITLAPHEIGFDAAVEFQPDGRYFSDLLYQDRQNRWLDRITKKLGLSSNRSYGEGNYIWNYSKLVDNVIANKPYEKYTKFPCVTPQWDNSARRKTGANIFHGSTPELYEKWLKATIDKIETDRSDENIVFINAWNEWGEGNHLEPCQKWGRAYLEATFRAVKGADTSRLQPLSSRSIVSL